MYTYIIFYVFYIIHNRQAFNCTSYYNPAKCTSSFEMMIHKQ